MGIPSELQAQRNDTHRDAVEMQPRNDSVEVVGHAALLRRRQRLSGHVPAVAVASAGLRQKLLVAEVRHG